MRHSILWPYHREWLSKKDFSLKWFRLGNRESYPEGSMFIRYSGVKIITGTCMCSHVKHSSLNKKYLGLPYQASQLGASFKDTCWADPCGHSSLLTGYLQRPSLPTETLQGWECKSSKITAGRTHCRQLFQKARIKQEKDSESEQMKIIIRQFQRQALGGLKGSKTKFRKGKAETDEGSGLFW